jgi:hypothetical protein
MEARKTDTESVQGTRLYQVELARTLTAVSVEEVDTAAMVVEEAAAILEAAVAKAVEAVAATYATTGLQL